MFIEKIKNYILLYFKAATWHGTSPHYMKKCIRDCIQTIESDIMSDHFHNEDIDKTKYIYATSIILTIVTMASAILFLSVKLNLRRTERRRSQ